MVHIQTYEGEVCGTFTRAGQFLPAHMRRDRGGVGQAYMDAFDAKLREKTSRRRPTAAEYARFFRLWPLDDNGSQGRCPD